MLTTPAVHAPSISCACDWNDHAHILSAFKFWNPSCNRLGSPFRAASPSGRDVVIASSTDTEFMIGIVTNTKAYVSLKRVATCRLTSTRKTTPRKLKFCNRRFSPTFRQYVFLLSRRDFLHSCSNNSNIRFQRPLRCSSMFKAYYSSAGMLLCAVGYTARDWLRCSQQYAETSKRLCGRRCKMPLARWSAWYADSVVSPTRKAFPTHQAVVEGPPVPKLGPRFPGRNARALAREPAL
jgi:hypothetical protein